VRQEKVPPPDDSDEEENPFVGPYRVFPGRLSVCRTFGDCEAKLAHLGGIKDVVSCVPEIDHEQGGVNYLDYVLIGSDGIFDKLKNDQINQIVWDVTTKAR
jgi:protein phosphatase 2C family protein 2/3